MESKQMRRKQSKKYISVNMQNMWFDRDFYFSLINCDEVKPPHMIPPVRAFELVVKDRKNGVHYRFTMLMYKNSFKMLGSEIKEVVKIKSVWKEVE